MRIYKHSNKNEYVATEDGIWIRNFCKVGVLPVNINDLNSDADRKLFLTNEYENVKRGKVYLNPSIKTPIVVIVSDGYDFAEQQALLSAIPTQNVHIFAVNGALAKWTLLDKSIPAEKRRRINYYIVNNPYSTCLKFLPHGDYYPKCIASSRVNHAFVERYKGEVSFYSPPDEVNFAGIWSRTDCMVDDYRNPVCAALMLAYRFGAKKIVLLGCDDSFAQERPGAVKLENGLWTYPPQIVAQRIIDLTLFWMQKTEIKIYQHSNGIKYNYCEYITGEEVIKVLNEQQ